MTGEGLLAATDEPWRAQRPVVQPAFHASGAPAVDHPHARPRPATDRALGPGPRRGGCRRGGGDAGAGAGRDRAAHCSAATCTAAAIPIWRARPSTRCGAVVDSVRFPHSALRLAAHARAPAAPRRDARSGGSRRGADRRRRTAPPPPGDLLDLLLAAYPDDERAVRDQVVTFLVAGHETLATALTWTFGLLAHHAAEQERAAAQAHGSDEPDARGRRLPVRGAAPLPAGLGDHPIGRRADRAGGQGDPRGRAADHQPLGAPPGSGRLGRSDGLRPGQVRRSAVGAGAQDDPARRVPAVRRRAAAVHRPGHWPCCRGAR